METFVDPKNKVLFQDEARRRLFEGLRIAAEAVGSTLGPKGKNVIIQRSNEMPLVTKDGVTVSRAINLRDPMQRMGAQLVREAASRTNDVAGDGTTTASVLTLALVRQGLRLIAAGHDATDVKLGIDSAVEFVILELQRQARPVTGSAEVAQVGTISANGDTTVGDLIAEAMDRVGKDGILTVDEAKGMATKLDVVDGTKFDRGYLSPYFVTNTEKMECVYENCLVMMTDSKVSSINDILPLLERVQRDRRPLLIVADDLDSEPLQVLIVNRIKGGLPVVAIKAPGYGEHRTVLLQDLAIVTGGKVVSIAAGMKLSNAQLDDLGTAAKVVVTRSDTLIVGSGKTKEDVEKRAAEVRAQLEDPSLSEGEERFQRERLARLAGGVATIKVGGATEVEMKERKDRVEDALNATRAAVEEGIIPGGGLTLARLAHDVRKCLANKSAVKAGIDAVAEACEAPFRKIIDNAGGLLNADLLLSEVASRVDVEGKSFGFNVASGHYGDMFAMGVIDPVKVTRTALENAASVAGIFLTLDCAIVADSDDGPDRD